MSELVVKDNALINASYNLSLVEQRLILLAIIYLRKKLLNGIRQSEEHLNFPIQITAESYINHFNVHRNTAYEVLKSACKLLFTRQFSYKEQRTNCIANITSRWVSKIAYIDETASIEMLFSQDVIPLITFLEKHLTSYELEQVAELTSIYAIRIYELLISWRSTGKTPLIHLEDFRNKLCLSNNEYERMYDFKKNILDNSIKQINEHTDIKVSYEQHKQGRTIVGFTFTFTQKKKTTDDKAKNVKQIPNWQNKGLSDAQIAKIACNLKIFVDANSTKIAPNDHRDYASIFKAWKPLLKDPNTINTFNNIQELLDT